MAIERIVTPKLSQNNKILYVVKDINTGVSDVRVNNVSVVNNNIANIDLTLKQDVLPLASSIGKVLTSTNVTGGVEWRDIDALPDQTGKAGKFLTTNGINTSWEIIIPPVWGNITGSLANQTDLYNALNSKQDALTSTQLSAVNSGITSTKVSTYDDYSTTKQDTLPTTTIAGKALISTTTAGEYTWGEVGKVDDVKVDGTSVVIDKIANIDISGKVDTTRKVNGHALSADVTVTQSDVGLGSVVNTGDSATPVENGTTKFTTGGAYTELNKKQDNLTETQLAAVNSTITAAKVDTYDGYQTTKQDKLTETQVAAIDSDINSIKVQKYEGYATTLKDLEDNKQNNLTATQLDAVNSGITSGKVADYNTATNNINELLPKVSTSATSTNKLLSASEVESKIATLSASPIYKDANQSSFETKAELDAATESGIFYDASGSQRTPAKNDYTYIKKDETHEDHLCRYIYTGSVWAFQVEMDFDVLTAGTGLKVNGDKLDHLRSVVAVETESIRKLTYDTEGHITGSSNVSVDTEATLDSVNLITSNAVKVGLNTKQGNLTTAQLAACDSGITDTLVAKFDSYDKGKQDKLPNADNAGMILQSTNTAGAVGWLSLTKSTVGLDQVVNTGDSDTPVENGTTKFTTGGAYTELNKKLDKDGGTLTNVTISSGVIDGGDF